VLMQQRMVSDGVRWCHGPRELKIRVSAVRFCPWPLVGAPAYRSLNLVVRSSQQGGRDGVIPPARKRSTTTATLR
jgi:hypothetical protein